MTTLPVPKTPSSAESSIGHEAAAVLIRKILVVENNRLHQKIAVRVLQMDDRPVTVVTTGEQALATLRQDGFDLILMASEMPDMTCVELTNAVRQTETATGVRIPIVVMVSGDAKTATGIPEGIDQYVAKPLEPDRLRRVVASLLPPADAEPIFDYAAALSRVQGDQAFLGTIASMFVEGAPALILEMRAAVDLRDGGRLARAAHKLKGGAYPFVAPTVTDAAELLESRGESGQMATAMAEFCRFEAAVNRLLLELTRLSGDERQPLPNLNSLADPEGKHLCTA